MNALALRGMAKGDFGRYSAGSINNQRAQARYVDACAGNRYADFRAKQHSGRGLPLPPPQ